VKRINISTADVEYDADDPEGFRAGMNRFGPSIGASMLGGSIYELPPGQSNCPYHYEYGNEEWLLVLDGRPVLRHPEGEVELEPGDVVCFPDGPEGAHKVTNRRPGTARIAIFSTKHDPSIAVYPDSDKIGVWPPGKLFRAGDAVDYWEGEER